MAIAADEGGEAEVFAEGGGDEENGDDECEADEDELAVGGEDDGIGGGVDGSVELAAEVEAKDDVGDGDGEQRGQKKRSEPAAEWRHAVVKDNEVRGVGDGQDEGGGVRNHGAGEEERQRVDAGAADGGENGGREDDCGGVVGEADGDGDAGEIEQSKEAGVGAAGVMDGDRGDPVEEALFAGDLGEEHHAREEEIDVGAFGDGAAGERERDKASEDEEQGAGADPVDLWDVAWTEEHQQDAGGDDGDEQGVRGERRHPCGFPPGRNVSRRIDALSVLLPIGVETGGE